MIKKHFFSCIFRYDTSSWVVDDPTTYSAWKGKVIPHLNIRISKKAIFSCIFRKKRKNNNKFSFWKKTSYVSNSENGRLLKTKYLASWLQPHFCNSVETCMTQILTKNNLRNL